MDMPRCGWTFNRLGASVAALLTLQQTGLPERWITASSCLLSNIAVVSGGRTTSRTVLRVNFKLSIGFDGGVLESESMQRLKKLTLRLGRESTQPENCAPYRKER
jgi:hypothetical protein